MKKQEYYALFIYVAAAVLAFFIGGRAKAASSAQTRIVKCDEFRMVPIYIRPNFGTIINFPLKPDNIVLGGQKQFGVEYIKNDIALTALSSNAHTNLFVYLLGRRCGFQLIATTAQHDNLVRVQDAENIQMKVKPE